jgi:hypothetical protein
MSSVDVMSELQIQSEQDLSKFRAAIKTARASFPAPAPKRFESEDQLFEHLEAAAARSSSSAGAQAPCGAGAKAAKVYPDNGPNAEAIKFVRKFWSSGAPSIDVKLNSFQRRQIHEAAAFLVKSEGFKISHESHGAGFTRCLVLRNLLMVPKEKAEKAEKAKEDLNACGCLSEDPKYCICNEF